MLVKVDPYICIMLHNFLNMLHNSHIVFTSFYFIIYVLKTKIADVNMLFAEVNISPKSTK